MLISLLGVGTYPIGYGIDYYYLVLILPALALSLFAQFKVKSTFAKYSQIASQSGYTGEHAARLILEQNGLLGVRVERVAGSLTDHFDPRTNVLRLSESTYANRSIAAIGVAAHEAGHAIQHDTGYLPNKVRSALVPLANIGSTAGPYMAMFGLILSMQILLNIGILLFGFAVLFYVVTLPVEFNASSRAMSVLEEQGMLNPEELRGARKVLSAAALTYIASALMAFASMLRLILLSRNRNRR